ncbi:ketopantoate reductase family protein [Arenibacterium halophilum]|uniref:2-dehydropantoate 2-reductase n=1 Tax=Arenibacterium halophilum TaxID=2583821 RepID=A0ABY2X0E5_9RHOB|nr:2-dehydropantoate 2-reductase N-terminal domain-containing protein [Arenibacterium halophilum]TMV08281.1 ketopantoate reductase family protein [Arenibacterium halophilum]
MRTIIYGTGAIGGAIAAALSLSGQEVVGIARGARQAAIAERGLLFRTPEGARRTHFPCVADPTEIELRSDDVILLTMKTQDTLPALERLRAAGVTDHPIFCGQNGVSNERFALRRFPEVHGVALRMPTFVVEPDDVVAFSMPQHGLLDIGCYGGGINAHDERMVEALTRANIAAFASDDIMTWKYGKLLFNLHNILEAALSRDADAGRLFAPVLKEGQEILTSCGIAFRDVANDPRRKVHMVFHEIDGVDYDGGSTTQSFVRGSGSVETDYINGEIALLARLNGLSAPANAYLTDLSARLLRERAKPGDMSADRIEAEMRACGVMFD